MKHMKTTTTILFTGLLVLTGCKKIPEGPATANAPADDGLSSATIIDLTHEFSEETVYWVTSKEFALDTVYEGQTDKGYYYSAYNFETAEHGGTHIDAPIHFRRAAAA